MSLSAFTLLCDLSAEGTSESESDVGEMWWKIQQVLRNVTDHRRFLSTEWTKHALVSPESLVALTQQWFRFFSELQHFSSSVQLDGRTFTGVTSRWCCRCAAQRRADVSLTLLFVASSRRQSCCGSTQTQFLYRLKTLYTCKRRERIDDNHVSFSVVIFF